MPDTASPITSPGVALAQAEVTLISVAYQTDAEVSALVDSLRTHPPASPWHLVIIDNASPDGSGASLARRYADAIEVTVLQSEANLGFGAANNRVAAAAQSPYLCFVNPDCLVDENPIDTMRDLLAARPEIGVVGVEFYAFDGSVQSSGRRFPSAAAGLGGRKSPIRKLWPNNPWSRHYLMDDQPMSPGEVRLVDWVAGTVMMVRREEFLALGGFDPEYFLFWEDADLCWQYRHTRRQQVAYLRAGHVRHQSGAAAEKAKPFSIRKFHESAKVLLCKRLYRFPLHPWRLFALFALSLREWLLLRRASREA